MKKTTPSHIIIKLLNISDKEKILKATTREQIYITYRGTKVRIIIPYERGYKNSKYNYRKANNILKR